ncbi:MAG: T9SS C-terminal target domain-containing protein [Cytophagales bacterium]|nr:MAG: T9SS C-terminal target domain-containing protein [Cytophagales bacterium]
MKKLSNYLNKNIFIFASFFLFFITSVLVAQPTIVPPLSNGSLYNANSPYQFTTSQEATTYDWNVSFGGDITGSSTRTPTITFNGLRESVTISLSGQYQTGTATNGTPLFSSYTSPNITITACSIAEKTPVVIGGSIVSVPYCNQSVDVEIQPMLYANSYQWGNLPAGWGISSVPMGTLSNGVFTTTATKITLTAPNQCAAYNALTVRGQTTFCGAIIPSRQEFVTIRRTPSEANVVSSIPNYIAKCDEVVDITYSIVNIACANYTWSLPIGWTLLSQNRNVIVARTNGINGGNVNVSMNIGQPTSCLQVNRQLSVPFTNEINTLRFTNTNTVPVQCNNASAVYSVVSSFGNPNNFTWTLTGSDVSFSSTSLVQAITTNTPNITVFAPASGDFPVLLTCNANNSCGGSSSISTNIWIGKPNLSPSTDIVAGGDGRFCFKQCVSSKEFSLSSFNMMDLTGTTDVLWTMSPQPAGLTIISYGQWCSLRPSCATPTGWYTLRAIARNNCGTYLVGLASVRIISPTMSCTSGGGGGAMRGIANETTEDIALSPNPTSDFSTIGLPKSEQVYQIQLSDLQGKFLFFDKTNEEKYKLNLQNYPSGIYILHLNNGEKTTIHKIVKQ